VKEKMELKQILTKKPMKLLILLLTALVIGTASATVYNYMYLQGFVTVGTAQIVWVKGSSAPSGTTITGSSVSMTLSAISGTNQTTTDCLRLKNNNPTVLYNMSIIVTKALPPANFTSAHIYLYDYSNSTLLQSISITTTNTYNTTLAGGRTDRLDFQIYANNSTTSGSFPFGIQVTYW
jgi:hypothetical protein